MGAHELIVLRWDRAGLPSTLPNMTRLTPRALFLVVLGLTVAAFVVAFRPQQKRELARVLQRSGRPRRSPGVHYLPLRSRRKDLCRGEARPDSRLLRSG